MKKWMVFMLIAMFSISSVACSDSTRPGSSSSQQTQDGNKKEEAAAKKVEIRFAWNGGDTRAKKYNQILDNFEKKYPNIKVSREFTDFDSFYDKLSTQMAGGNAADVLLLVGHKYTEYATRGQLLALNELISSGKIKQDDYNPASIKQGSIDGKQYLIGLGITHSSVFYNADQFKKLGVEAPSFEWTWDDFIKKATELKSAIKQDGLWAIEDLAGWEPAFNTWLLQRGKDLYTKEGKLGFDKKDMMEYFSMWDNLRKTGVTPPPNIQAQFPTEKAEQSMFAQGKVLMFMRPFNQLAANLVSLKDNAELVRLPQTPTGKNHKAVDMFGTYFGIYAKTKNPNEAALLVNYIVNEEESTKILLGEHGALMNNKMNPVIKPLLQPVDQKGIEYAGKIAGDISIPNTPPPGSNEVIKQLRLANESVAFGKKSIEKAVNDFFVEAGKILK